MSRVPDKLNAALTTFKDDLKYFPRYIRRFIVGTPWSDVLLFIFGLIVVSASLTIFTASRIAVDDPRTMMFAADTKFCERLLQSDGESGIQCKFWEERKPGKQTTRFSFVSDENEFHGSLQFHMDHGFSFSLLNNEGSVISSHEILGREAILPGAGVFSTQINATHIAYEGLISAALKDISKLSDAGWSNAEMEAFATNVTTSFLASLKTKAKGIERTGPYSGMVPLLMYFMGYMAVLGYATIGFATLYTQRRFGERISDQLSVRLSIFDYMVDALPALGLIGTMLGLITAMGAFELQDNANSAVVEQMAKSQLNAGIKFAAYTTLIGLVAHISIKLFVCYPFNLFAFARTTKLFGFSLRSNNNQ